MKSALEGLTEDDRWPSRGGLDRHAVEAEATAYVVTGRLGLASHACVSRYPTDDAEGPESASFHATGKVAGRIENMSLGIQRNPRPKSERARREGAQ